MHFLDQAKIFIRSGAGGPGAVSFRREKYVEYGGPDGGDGGKGGDVVFEVKATLNTLSAFRQNEKFAAQPGKNGGGSQMTGRGAEDLIISVPPGTVIYDAETGALLGDLTDPGQRLTVLAPFLPSPLIERCKAAGYAAHATRAAAGWQVDFWRD